MTKAKNPELVEFNNGYIGSSGLLQDLRRLYEQGRFDEAIQVVDSLCKQGRLLSTTIFHCLLRLCIRRKNLVAGRKVHSIISRSGYESNTYLGSHLVHMFALCGSLAEANYVFARLPKQNVFTWCAIISAHTKLGQGEQALKIYKQMQGSGLNPGEYVFNATLQACSNIADLVQGRLTHSHIVGSGLEADVYIGNTLISMYAKCGSIMDACSVFDKLPTRSAVTWSSMIEGYAQHGHGQEALQLFKQMRQGGTQPNKVTFVSILKACFSMLCLDQGRLIHALIIENGLEFDLVVGNTLINVYAKCGSVEDACRVFNRLLNKNVVTWSTMITAYRQHGNSDEALQVFQQMQHEGIEPDNITFVSTLKACSNAAVLDKGRLVHEQFIEKGCNLDDFIGSALIDMYFCCSNLEDACNVFETLSKQSIVPWNAMIAGYSQCGHVEDALDIFQRMQQVGVDPDNIACASILTACSATSALAEGKQIHACVMADGVDLSEFVKNALIDMYAKCGSLENALRLFDTVPKRDVVTWSAVIAGCLQHGHGHEALQLFREMHLQGIEPDNVAFLCTLKACSNMVSLDQGKLIHAHIIENGCELDVPLGNSLIDMYAKCGSLKDASMVFGKVSKENVTTWNAMIAGYAQHAYYKLALLCFEDMQRKGLKPNRVTFVCLLSACNMLGLVQEGCYHFNSIGEKHGITPSLDHYICLVELLGRAGSLLEAADLLQSLPFAPNIVVWMSLLTHCKSYGNIELAKKCFNSIVALDSEYASGYIILSSMYADAGMLEDAGNVQELRKHAKAWKKPGQAFIEVEDEVHDFVVGDQDHMKANDIYVKLRRLSIKMKREGYLPCLGLVPHAIMD